MKVDVIASEPHFADHLRPLWAELVDRGRFLVPPTLAAHAGGLGIDAIAVPGLAGDSATLVPDGQGDMPVLVASYGDVKRARATGRRRIVFLEHGIGQSYAGDREAARNGSYPGGADRDDVGLFLVPNEHAAGRWRAAYPKAEVSVVGCPKLDSLPVREPGAGPVVALSFHWPCSACPETHPAYPHYAAVLPAIARRFRTIGHAHPRYWQLARSYQRLGIPFAPLFDDVCRQADVYICDNSSTLYEFAATGRPVVVLNSPDYRRHVDHGLRFWSAANVGIQVNEPSELAGAIERALENRADDVSARNDALDQVYAVRTGAAAAAAAVLERWVAARQLVAA